ncbi:MAG: DNA replication and repair protein RecF [Bacteroidota bacterium]
MVLKQIDLQNFRLHSSTALNFSDKLNLIIGGNGQGKTTILEAIYYLSTSKNINLASENDVVSFGKEYFEAKGMFAGLSNNSARIYYDNFKNKKNYFLDDKQVFRVSEIIGKFPIVTLIQSDHAITQGAPAERRRFVDSVISQASHAYLDILLDYNKVLKQRSSLLARIKETNSKILLEQLEAWTDSLITNGAELIKHRLLFVKEFIPYLKEAYRNIIEEAEEPVIEYDTFQNIDEQNTIQRYREELAVLYEDELRRGMNLAGPHRDDFIFYINGKELKRFGSQGQHKTYQIALRFAQFFFIKEKLGKTPIFLMDDVFGELDTFRAKRISEYLSKIGQAFITMTDFSKIEELNLTGESKIIKVENGTAQYV